MARAKAERNKGDAGVGQEGALSSGFPDLSQDFQQIHGLLWLSVAPDTDAL